MSPQTEFGPAAGYDGTSESSAIPRQGFPGRIPVRIPTLQSDALDPNEYAHTCCFAAGYLTVKNAGWRNQRPVVHLEKCTGCLKCYMYCPDGTVFKVPNVSDNGVNRTDTSVAIDLDFCKGCGICERACKFGAIEMVSEALARKNEEHDETSVDADQKGVA